MSVPKQIHGFDTDAREFSAEVVSLAAVSGGAPRESVGVDDRAEFGTPGLFSDLVAAYIPALCDGLRIDLSADGAGGVIATYPRALPGAERRDGGLEALTVAADGGAADQLPAHPRSPGRVVIPARSVPMAGEPVVSGTITCRWRDVSRPTDADVVVAQLLADQAVAMVRLHTLDGVLRRHQERAANLELALASNREIGQALGILMATEHLTDVQAFDRLRTVSQQSHRKLRAIAADVVQTGALSSCADVEHLESGATPGDPSRRPVPRERNGDTSVQRVARRSRAGQPCLAVPAASGIVSDG